MIVKDPGDGHAETGSECDRPTGLGEVEMVEPLRKRRKDGTAYSRRPDVEKELLLLEKLTLADVLAREREEARQGKTSLSSESLVYTLRREVRHASTHDRDLGVIDGLASLLLQRCEVALRRQLCHLDEFHREEVCHEVLDRTVDEIYEDRDSADYAEVNFNDWLAHNRTDALRKQLGKLKHSELPSEPIEELSEAEAQATPQRIDAPTSQGPTPESEYALTEARENAALPRSIKDGEFSPEDRYQIAAMVRRANLPSHVLEAFLLHHYWGMNIESKDPDKHTLVKHFGKGEKTIRLWIARAEKTFAHLRGENNEPETDATTEPGLGAARLPR